MDNPFSTAAAKVADLQDQHDKLERAIPKLQQIEGEFQKSLKSLGERETALMARLEQLGAIIKNRTDKFNAYLKDETGKLEDAKRSFHMWRDELQARLTERGKKQDSRELAMNRRAIEINAKADEVSEAVELVNSRIAAINKFSDEVDERARIVGGREEEADIVRKDIDSRAKELDSREAFVEQKETDTSKRETASMVDRSAAATMLEKAKEHQAQLDSRDIEQDRREALIDGRERDLNALAIRLNDRKAVEDFNAKNT